MAVNSIIEEVYRDQGYKVLGTGGTENQAFDAQDILVKDGHVIYAPEMAGCFDEVRALLQGGTGSVECQARTLALSGGQVRSSLFSPKEELQIYRHAAKQIQNDISDEDKQISELQRVLDALVAAGQTKTASKHARQLLKQIERSDMSAVGKYYSSIKLGIAMSKTDDQALAVSAFKQSMNDQMVGDTDISFYATEHVEQRSSLSEDSKQQVYDALMAVVLRNNSPQIQVENLGWLGRLMPDKEKAQQVFDQALAVLNPQSQEEQAKRLPDFEVLELKGGIYLDMARRKDGALNTEARAGFEKTYQEIAAQEKSKDKMICFERLVTNLGLSDLPLDFVLEQYQKILTTVLDDLRVVCAEGDGGKVRDIGLQAKSVHMTMHTFLVSVGNKMTETEFENEFGSKVQEIDTLFSQHADFTYD